MNFTIRFTLFLSIYLVANLTMAEEPRSPSITGSLTATAQTASDSRAKDEAQASVDLEGVLPLGPGDLNVHVESSTTVGTNGISNVIGEANADTGSATDRYGHGRVQISGLFYALPLEGATLGIGLLDATSNLDNSDIANDENTQFLAGPLVNNPTIEFPDYTIGLTLDAEPESAGFGYHLFLGSSHGLGDNDKADYSQLIELDRRNKGIFTAAEGVWKNGTITSRLGIWLNSSDHERLDGTATNANNYGVYGVLNGPLGAGTWGLRAGWADPSVSDANWALGAAMEYPVSTIGVAGLGMMHTEVSSDIPDSAGFNAASNLTAEAYLRLDLIKHLQITPLIQYVQNSNFNSSTAALDQDLWIFGARLHVELP